MNAEDVAQYLQNNPQFFEYYAAVLAKITIPHPYSGRTISLNERQLLTLREQNKHLEKKIQEIIQFAHENDALQQKLHQFTLSLFGVIHLTDLKNVITQNVREIFSVPHVSIRIWKEIPSNPEVQDFIKLHLQPFCVHQAKLDTASWFGESASHLHSFAYLPLHAGEQPIGLLILASEDKQRFHPDMGMLFLQQIAEIASYALRPSL